MPSSQLYQPLQTLRIPKGSKNIFSNVDVMLKINQDSYMQFVNIVPGSSVGVFLVYLEVVVITDPDKPGDWTQQASLEYEIIDFPLHQDSWYFVNTRVVVDSQHEGGVTNTINDNGDINYPG